MRGWRFGDFDLFQEGQAQITLFQKSTQAHQIWSSELVGSGLPCACCFIIITSNHGSKITRTKHRGLRDIFASQKCQQSQGSGRLSRETHRVNSQEPGGSQWRIIAELSPLLTRLVSSRLKSVNNHRDRGSPNREEGREERKQERG